MAIIVLVAAALARPSLQGTGWVGDQEAPVAVAMVFDTQPRMEYRYQNQTRLESGRETALWLLSQLPRESDVAVIDARYGSGVFAVDLGAARQRIERLTTGAVGAPLGRSLEDALRLLKENSRAERDLRLHRSGSRRLVGRGQRVAGKANPGTPGYWLVRDRCRPGKAAEFRHHGLATPLRRRLARRPLSIEADLAHLGPAGQRNIELYLDDNGKLEQRGEQSVTFDQDEPTHVDLHLGGLDRGLHQGFVKLSGTDALSADDIRYFSVEVVDARKVLLAAPAPADDYTFLLHEVLAPYELRLKKEAKFDCHVVALDQLAKQPLAEYAAVCLVDPTPLTDDVWQQLAEYAAGGGGVAIFLGATPGRSRPLPLRPRSKSFPANWCGSGALEIATSIWRRTNSNIHCWPSSVRWKARSRGTLIPSTPTGSSGPWPREPPW